MRPIPSSIQGILWMVLMTVMDAALLTTVRYLGETDLPPRVMVASSYSIGFLIMLPLALRRPGIVKTRQRGLYALRGFLEVTATFLVFSGLLTLPLSEAKAIAYLTPVLAMLGAAFVLKERLTRYRVMAVAAGFLGMLLITRPDASQLDLPGVFMVMGSATIYAGCSLLIKKLAREDGPDTIVLYMFLFTMLFAVPLSLVGTELAAVVPHLPVLVLLGAIGYIIQFAVTRAFVLAPLNVVIPYSFISLVLVSMSGYVLFGETPRPSTFAGAGVILMAVCYAAWREAKRSGLIDKE